MVVQIAMMIVYNDIHIYIKACTGQNIDRYRL